MEHLLLFTLDHRANLNAIIVGRVSRRRMSLHSLTGEEKAALHDNSIPTDSLDISINFA